MENLNNIVTDDMMEMVFNVCDQIIEHIHQNTSESVNNDEFLGFIIEKLVNKYSMGESIDTGSSNKSEIFEALHSAGDPYEVKNYLNALNRSKPITEGWNVEEFVNDFERWKISPKDYEGNNFISEEELLKHRFMINSK